MSSTKLNGKNASRRDRKSWLGAATAVALLAGSATMTMAASRGELRTSASRAPVANFNWQTFAPGHLVHLNPPGGGSAPLGDMRSENLRAPAVGFAWQSFAPGHLVHYQRPGGSGHSSAGNAQTDALRAPAVGFVWQRFAPGHVVHIQPSNGARTSEAGGMHTDALRSAAFRPTLVYGLSPTETGGFRAEMGLSFRIR